MGASEGVTERKKVKKKGSFNHCRLVMGTCASYRDIHVKGTGEGWVREGLQEKNILCTSSPKDRLFGGRASLPFLVRRGGR